MSLHISILFRSALIEPKNTFSFTFPNECVNKLPEPVSCLLLSLDTTTVSGVVNLTITILKVIHLA